MKMLPWRADGAVISGPPTRFSATLHHLSIELRCRELERAWLETLTRLSPFEIPAPESRQSLLQSLIAIDQILGALKPRVRDVFLWAQFEGLNIPQIALRLDIPAWLVESDLATALRHCYALRSDLPSSTPSPSPAGEAPAQIADVAIRWMVKLHFDAPSVAVQQAFAQWVQADTRHVAVSERLQWLQEGLADMPPLLALETLQAATRLRRRMCVKHFAPMRLWAAAALTYGCQLIGESACACMRYWTKLPLGRG